MDGCDSRVTCTCGVSLNESFGKSLFIGKLYGIDCFRFLEDDCLAERVSSAWHRVAGGVTRETDLIVSTLGARCAGHEARARARLAAGESPVIFPSVEPSSAEIGRARPARKRPVRRKKHIFSFTSPNVPDVHLHTLLGWARFVSRAFSGGAHSGGTCIPGCKCGSRPGCVARAPGVQSRVIRQVITGSFLSPRASQDSVTLSFNIFCSDAAVPCLYNTLTHALKLSTLWQPRFNAPTQLNATMTKVQVQKTYECICRKMESR